MRVSRLHVDGPLAIGDRIVLPETAAGHLVRVLRAGIGDACVLFNGDGNDYDARITGIGKRSGEVEIVAARTLDNESPLRITLLQALARGEKMDWILQKATELGVADVIPVESERSEVKLDGERVGKRVAHWQSVIVAACEQSGRAVVPAIAPPQPLANALRALPSSSALRLLLDPKAGQALDVVDEHPDRELVLAIGPEGGWSPRDRELLRAAGFEGMRLGPRILRTETAGIAAIAVLQSRLGDVG
jgi:16S rRNA (uracil1498-N3)-methyltransferase